MMKLNRKKSAGQFLIDLTPLLDVVFILLIVVLTLQNNFSDEAEKKLADAQQMEEDASVYVSEAETEVATANTQLETYANLNDYINVITVSADYNPTNIKYRNIYIRINDTVSESISLNPSNGELAWKNCAEIITKYLDSNPDIPAIYTIENKKMLYRDEIALSNLFDKISSSYPNIYLRRNTENEDE